MRLIAAAVVSTCFASMAVYAQAPRTDPQSSSIPRPPADSPAGLNAYSCGVPAPAGEGATRPVQAIFPAGRYPVTLPAVSLLGARNDLPNPYRDGADWGQLPSGRKWGS